MMDLEKRKSYIGASECASVLGLSRWGTPLSVWALKTGQVEPKVLDSTAVDLGNELEDYVSRRFMKESGKKIERVNKTIFHPKHSFIAVNLDRRVLKEDADFEAKTASAWKAEEWADGKTPIEYETQCHHSMLATGRKKVYLSVLIGNQDFQNREFNRDEKILSQIEEKLVDFWVNYVLTKTMPVVIKAGDSDTLNELFDSETIPDPIELSDEASQLAEFIYSSNQDYKSLENQIETSKNKLKAMIGEHGVGTTGLWKISWLLQNIGRIDIKKLKKEMPEIYDKYMPKDENGKPLKHRVLRMTQKEEK